MTTMPWLYSATTSNRVRAQGRATRSKLFRLVREDIALDGKGKKKATAGEDVLQDPAAADDKIAVLVQNGTRTGTLAAGRPDARARWPSCSSARASPRRWRPTTVPAEETTVIRYPSADLEGDAQRGRQGPRDPDELGEEVDGRLRGDAGRRRRLARRARRTRHDGGRRPRRPDSGEGRLNGVGRRTAVHGRRTRPTPGSAGPGQAIGRPRLRRRCSVLAVERPRAAGTR